MKVTRYYQSCLLLEEGTTRVLFDASGQEKQNLEKFGKLDALIYTHEHGDHFDAELAEQIQSQNVPIYVNASTAKQMKQKPNIVANGQEFSIGDFKFKAVELPHCLMVDGSPGPQNTGYLVNNKFFNPGDGKVLAGLQVENLALPIIGPDISFKDAIDFAKQLSAKNLIPVHYDGMGAKPEMLNYFVEMFKLPYKITILANGASTEIS